MASVAYEETQRGAASWREHITITRMGVFSVVFILAGLQLLLRTSFPPDVTTTLTFGTNLPEIPVPTMAYVIAVGLLYLAGGVVGLLPMPNLKRVKNIWLLINGILIIPTILIVVAAGGSTNITVMLQVSLRLSTPIVLGALAGIWCERSGVVNIAIEGMMLTGAAFGFVALTLLVSFTEIPTSTALWIGLAAAILSGGAMALLHAWLSITFKTDQIVSGTVINILAVGLTSFLRREILLSSDAGRETLQAFPIIRSAADWLNNQPVTAGVPEAISNIAHDINNLPVVGEPIQITTHIVNEVLLSGRPIFYSMFILLIVTHVVLYHTRWGLRTRAVGENPKAADTLGINVIANRWTNVFIGGLIAGLAGAWFSLETTGSFDDNMTSGRGFIALAAMIFGKWTPGGAFAGGLLFGFSDALGQRFQFLGVEIPPQFLQMVPYIITIIVLAGLVGRAIPPKADGIPYDKEGK